VTGPQPAPLPLMIALKLKNPDLAAKLAAWIIKYVRDGKAETWEVVELNDGSEAFTHTARQYDAKGFISLPEVSKGTLIFEYVPGDEKLEGIYKGRFVEMLLNHVSKYAKVIFVTPL
jgi:hypothetical protein